jgi:hypothetical protein
MGRKRKKMKDIKRESQKMSMSKERWKIRFGQIFQVHLEASGKKLEDHLYFFNRTQPVMVNVARM